MFWPRARVREETRRIPRFTPCPYIYISSNDYPDIRHRKKRRNKVVNVPAEKDIRAMNYLEKKVEDLKLIVPDIVRGICFFPPAATLIP
jgi:hypothetical protein